MRRRTAPGAPHVVGVTGPPGAGKSTLVDALIAVARGRGERVAVVAVDPSSPFSGGAILGDRIRMEAHGADDGVYLRSMASRGHLGGVGTATHDVVDLLDLDGFDRILVETVGVGQSELAVMGVADTVVVAVTPESGDAIQTMKAGLLEIADVFVVNKADRDGAGRMANDLRRMVELADEDPNVPTWRQPVLETSAVQRTGVEALALAVDDHLAWCVGAGRPGWERRRADGRVRQYFDLVAERSVALARSRLAAADLSALRSGAMSAWALLERDR